MVVNIFHAAISYSKDTSRLRTRMEALFERIIIDALQ